MVGRKWTFNLEEDARLLTQNKKLDLEDNHVSSKLQTDRGGSTNEGLCRHCPVQDTEKDTDSRPSTVQDFSNSTILYEKGQVYATEFPRQTGHHLV